MRISIMQPYLFPYIGYFQLINAVDQFVIYDDAQWIKQGWINRNRLLVNGKPSWFTLPVESGSLCDQIGQKSFSKEFGRTKRKILIQIEQNYRKSSQFHSVMPLLQHCFGFDDDLVMPFVVKSLRECCKHIEINTPFCYSSEFPSENSLRAEARVLELCSGHDATRYINPIGGQELYHGDHFTAKGIELHFLESRVTPYPQPGTNEFIPFLSIIDVLMNNPVDRVREMLEDFDLIKAQKYRSQ